MHTTETLSKPMLTETEQKLFKSKLDAVYRHYAFVGKVVNENLFEKFFITTGRSLVVASPNLLALAKRFSIKVDYLKCGKENKNVLNQCNLASGKYQSIIADLDEKSPSHPAQNLHDPSYMVWLRLAFDRYLEDNGVLIFKMPLTCLRTLIEKDRNGNSYYKRMDIVDMFINHEDNYVIVKIYKRPYNGCTELIYSEYNKKITCNIHKTIISPLYDEQVLNVINSFVNDPHKIEYIRIGGRQVKNGTNETMRETYGDRGLFMRTNSTKVKFELLEYSKLKSSGVIFPFKDKETRDKYYDIVNTKKMIDLISLLSYNNTIPHSIIPLVLHPTTLEYAQSV
jgi:hypothetical protein